MHQSTLVAQFHCTLNTFFPVCGLTMKRWSVGQLPAMPQAAEQFVTRITATCTVWEKTESHKLDGLLTHLNSYHSAKMPFLINKGVYFLSACSVASY